MEKKTIGSFISVLRKANGMTQKNLADRLGVSDKAVSRWERDECAPDLSLIPVIAEVFGITADELLRGEKNSAESLAPTAQQTAKTEKQLQYMADSVKSRYKIFSIISVSLSFVGVLASAFSGYIFENLFHYQDNFLISFGFGALFLAAAVVCEVIFTIMYFSKIRSDGEALDGCKRSLMKISLYAFTFIAVAVCAVIAVAMSFSRTVLQYRPIIFFAVSFVLCIILSQAVYRSLMKKGVYPADEAEKEKLRRLDRLKIRCAVPVAAALLFTAAGHIVFENKTSSSDFVKGIAFDNYEGFVEYMEKLVDRNTDFDGRHYNRSYRDNGDTYTEILTDDNGELVLETEYKKGRVLDLDGNVILEYCENNHSVSYIELSDTETRLPITVYESSQLSRGYKIKRAISAAIFGLYIAEAAIGTAVYFSKRKKLPDITN